MLIHQLLHGYRRGHELLASSIQLSAEDSEIVTRLSDLSGSLISESEFQPYLTVFPLPSEEFYVLAKTWLDKSAPRTGCVVTHTLLVPTPEWKKAACPSGFAKFFSPPSNLKDLKSYEKPLEDVDLTNTEIASVFESQNPRFTEFVGKYFGQGLRPIVWFEQEQAEEVLWLILNGLWPELRAQFASCTYCLQQRVLEDKTFDLMFAPSAAYSRFHNVPRENILGAFQASGSSTDLSGQIESWCFDWTEALLNRSGINGVKIPNFEELKKFLGSEPTTIKKLFLVKELQKRSTESPTAAVGLMDVIAALAPKPSSADDLKENSVRLAMSATRLVADAKEALDCCFLISERLRRPEFKMISETLIAQLCSRVSELTANSPDSAIRKIEHLFVSHEDTENCVFVTGVIDGICALGIQAPKKLSVLHDSQILASTIISKHPHVALHYMEGMKLNHSVGKAVNDILSWISPLSIGASSRRTIRNLFISQITSEAESPLLEELLNGLETQDVHEILDQVSQSKQVLKLPKTRRLLSDRICRVHSSCVRDWAMNTEHWNKSVAFLVANTYLKEASGVSKLLEERRPNIKRDVQILAAFVDSIYDDSLPHWFKDSIKHHPQFLLRLLALGSETPQEAAHAVGRILEEVSDIPLVTNQSFLTEVGNMQDQSFANCLNDQASRRAIACFIDGDIDISTYKAWQATPWGHKWLLRIPHWELKSIITRKLYGNSMSWDRAWILLGALPVELISQTPSPLYEFVKGLIAPGYPWTPHATSAWVKIMRRASKEIDRADYLRLCVHALKYAFGNQSYDLSGLVVEAFSPLYDALTITKDAPSEASDLVGFFWDKGKELRRQLVDAFLNSTWPPGDLALAVKEVALLRKIVKRLQRSNRGDTYVARMLDDLADRKDKTAIRLDGELAKLARNPDFQEEWD